MNVLLINLTRFGDLLQSQAGIAALAGQGHSVGLICLDNFLAATGLLNGVQAVFPLAGGGMLRHLDHSSSFGAGQGEDTAFPPRGDWPAGLAALADWRAGVWASCAPDIVVNLTPTLPARLLSRFVANNRPVVGFGVDENGFGANAGAWASLLQGAKGTRGASPFNIVDVFKRIMEAAVAPPYGEKLPGHGVACQHLNDLQKPAEDMRRAMEHTLAAQAPKGCKGYVAFQLGASEQRRQWPVEFFAEVGRRCWEEQKLCPVLLGTKAEISLVEQYAQSATGPFISLCGKTGLTDLADALCSVRFLLTNDTGTIHLAAGLDVPLLAIFLATAQPFDTGPYRAGSCSLEPDLACHPCSFGVACPHGTVCRVTIPAETVWVLLSHFLKTGSFTGVRADELAGARVWVASWAGSEPANTVLALEAVTAHGQGDRAVWFTMQQVFLQSFLSRDRKSPFAPALPCVCLSAEGGGALQKELASLGGYIELLEKQGQLLLLKNLPPMREKFMQSWQRVTEGICHSLWFAALGPLWIDDTQEENQSMQEALATIHQYAELLQAVGAASLHGVERG